MMTKPLCKNADTYALQKQGSPLVRSRNAAFGPTLAAEVLLRETLRYAASRWTTLDDWPGPNACSGTRLRFTRRTLLNSEVTKTTVMP